MAIKGTGKGIGVYDKSIPHAFGRDKASDTKVQAQRKEAGKVPVKPKK